MPTPGIPQYMHPESPLETSRKLTAKQSSPPIHAARTFEVLGLMYLLVVLACALAMRNHPEGYMSPGHSAADLLHAGTGLARFHTSTGAWNVAMVSAMAYFILKYDGGNCDHSAGISDDSGDFGSVGRDCAWCGLGSPMQWGGEPCSS